MTTTDPELNRIMRNINAGLADVAKRVKRLEVGSRQSQLPFSTIDNGALKVANPDGSTMIIGKQPDGTSAITTQAAPPPPQTSKPLVFSTIEGATATWNGLDLNGDTMPASFDHVEVHAQKASDFVPTPDTKMGIIPRVSGSFPLTGLTAGVTYYIRLVAVSTSGSASLPSVQTSVVPLAPPNAGGGGGGDLMPPGEPTVSTTIPVSTYIDPSGDTRAMAVVSWEPPTTNADGTQLTDGNYFEVQYRPTTPAGAPWQSVYIPWGS